MHCVRGWVGVANSVRPVAGSGGGHVVSLHQVGVSLQCSRGQRGVNRGGGRWVLCSVGGVAWMVRMVVLITGGRGSEGLACAIVKALGLVLGPVSAECKVQLPVL